MYECRCLFYQKYINTWLLVRPDNFVD